MSRFFESLEAQLDQAARAQAAHGQGAGAPASRRAAGAHRVARWVRAGGRALPVAFATLATLAVVVVALSLHPRGHAGSLASHHAGAGRPAPSGPSWSASYNAGGMQILGNPLGLSPQQQHDLSYVVAAETQAMKTHACVVGPPLPPTTSQGTPSARLLSLLGVLRRPATPADALTAPRGAHVPFFPLDAQKIFVRYVRRARVLHGVSYWIVPAGRLRQPPSYASRCFVEWRSALRRELPRIPIAQRSVTLAIGQRLIAAMQHGLASVPSDGICILDLNRAGAGGGTCETAGQLASGQSFESDGSTVIGVVPDGVASVTLHYPASRGEPALTVSAPVVANVYAVSVARAGTVPAAEVIWRSADGAALKTIKRP